MFLRGIFEELIWFLKGQTNSKILEHVKEDLYLEDNILQDLELLDRYPENSSEYQKVYQRGTPQMHIVD